MKQLLVAVLIMAAAGSAYAQGTDLFELAKSGTPQSIQATIDKGADVNDTKQMDDGYRTPL